MSPLRRFAVLFALAPLVTNVSAQVRIVVEHGHFEGHTYVNQSIGVSFHFPDEWTGVLEPPDAPEPAMRLLRATPRENKGDRRMTLDVVAQKYLPADQQRDPAAFLAANGLAQRGAFTEARARTPLHPPVPTEVSSHPFLRADYRIAAAQPGAGTSAAPELYESQVAGVVNGHMLLLSVVAPTAAEASDLADNIDDLAFSPPAGPLDPPEAQVVQAPSAGPVQRIGLAEDSARARLVNKVEPGYPPDALSRAVEGDVVVQVIVGADGRVLEASVVSGHPLLNDAALDAVKQWRFLPYVLEDGKPAEVETRIRVRFRLASAKTSS